MARIQIQSLPQLQQSRKKDRKLILIAAALGLTAMMLNLAWAYKTGGTKLNLLKAKKTLLPGTKIAPGDVEVVAMWGRTPAAMRQDFITVEDLANYESLMMTGTIEADHFVTRRAFSGDAGPAAGKVYLPVSARDDVQTLGGAIQPGNLINIWGLINGKQLCLKSGARVVAVGPREDRAPSDNRERYNTITIEVDEDEQSDLLTNLHLAGNTVWPTKVSLSESNRQSKALAAQNIAPPAAPEPTPTPAAAQGKASKKQKK